MAYQPINLGQKPMSSSLSVTMANDQTPVSVTGIFSVLGTVPVTQGTSPWIVTGSVQGSFSPSGNQSVSGTVQADIRGSIAAVIIGGSIATATTNSSVVLLNSANVIGSVAALQGTPEWTVKSSLAGGIFPISGSVAVGNFPANQNVSGSVVAFQGTPPWVTVGSVYGNISGSVAAWLNSTNASVITVNQASVAVNIIAGSIAATFTPPANQSVSGTVNVRQDSTWIASVYGNVSVLGTVPVTQSGSWTTSVVGNMNASVQVVGPMTTSVVGSVTAYQGAVPWTVNFQNSSVLAVPVGSVLTVPTSSTIAVVQANSVAGTYAEDAAHAQSDRGLFTLGVRNDLMASVTSADRDYTAPSFGPVGEALVANAPITKWVRGETSVMYGTSVQAIAAQGSSIFTYVTAVQVANTSANTVLVRLTGGLGSTLGWTVAPAGGGSNITYPNALRTGENSGFSASISGAASVYLSAQGFTAGA